MGTNEWAPAPGAAEQFIARWDGSGGSESGPFQSFVVELCALLDVPPPDPAKPDLALNDYVFERRLTDRVTGNPLYPDLYARGRFIMEGKQSAPARRADPDQLTLEGTETAQLRGHATRGTRAWDKVVRSAYRQARNYMSHLPGEHENPPFILVADVGHVIDVYADFSGQGRYAPFPDRRAYRIGLRKGRTSETLPPCPRTTLRSRLSLIANAGSVPVGNKAPNLRWRDGAMMRKSLELFAGAGGLGMGLYKAGFEPCDVVEWDQWCCDTLEENAKRTSGAVSGWHVTRSDIREVDFSPLEDKLELVSGGPPCQPFSLGGKHAAYSDQRDMFPHAIRAVRETRPRAFVFENVKGLTRAAFHAYFQYIRLQLEHPELEIDEDDTWEDHLYRLERHHTRTKRSGLNYRVVTRVLNAADYGVPQKRERVLFVGFRDDMNAEWSFPAPTHSKEALLWEQFQDETYWERHDVPQTERAYTQRLKKTATRIMEKPKTKPWKTVRDAIHDLPEPPPEATSELPDHRLQPGARSYPGHTGSPLDEPAKTLKAGVHGVPGGENMLSRADGSVRYFSIRESARLQTFPDDFRFHGAWSETMRQLGNAVPVRLGKVVGESVARRLDAA